MNDYSDVEERYLRVVNEARAKREAEKPPEKTPEELEEIKRQRQELDERIKHLRIKEKEEHMRMRETTKEIEEKIELNGQTVITKDDLKYLRDYYSWRGAISV